MSNTLIGRISSRVNTDWVEDTSDSFRNEVSPYCRNELGPTGRSQPEVSWPACTLQISSSKRFAANDMYIQLELVADRGSRFMKGMQNFTNEIRTVLFDDGRR